MIYSNHNVCPICLQGQIGFRKCRDSEDIVLMCDECDSIWLEPNAVRAENVIYVEPPHFIVPMSNCSILNSQWANRDEVYMKGWENYIRGEGKALDEQ